MTTAIADIPLTIEHTVTALRTKQVASRELVAELLSRADDIDSHLGCYVSRFDRQALRAAALADKERSIGIDRGPLHGVPLALKDVIAAREGETTAQSCVLDRKWGNGKDAYVTGRLRSAGAIILGKTSTMEFAMGFPDPSQDVPLVRNPWDPSTWAGGSSSGSANGVAARLFPGALGTDTGGSVRSPSAYCGVTGLMPTYGAVPVEGCVPLTFSMDRVGPIARTAKDCKLILNALMQSTYEDALATDVCQVSELNGVRIGVATNVVEKFSTQSNREVFELALGVLRSLGAELREVKLPLYDEVIAAWLLTAASEVTASHQRDLAIRWDDYWPTTRWMATWGRFVSGADYVQAQRVRRVGQEKLRQLFRDIDVVATPTCLDGSPSWETIERGEILGELGSVQCNYWNALAGPAMSLPAGFTPSGLPLGLQIASLPHTENLLVRVGMAFQGVTTWHLQSPNHFP